MRKLSIGPKEVIIRLMETFRLYGFDGTNMVALAEATGLKKASLYHRFPGGKREMGDVVLKEVQHWIELNVVNVLTSDRSPQERLETALNHLADLYAGGRKSCTLPLMLQGSGQAFYQKQIQTSMLRFIYAFEQYFLSTGSSPTLAQVQSKEILIRIQGALVLSRCLEQPDIFLDTLRDIQTSV